MRTRILGAVALLAVAAASAYALFGVPADLNQGDAQRVMYVHVPSAWLAYLSFGVTALAGIGWLWRRDLRFDWLAVAGAEIGVMFTAFTLWAGDDVGPPGVGRLLPVGGPAHPLHHASCWPSTRATSCMRRMTDDPIRRANRAAVVGLHRGARHPDRPLQRRVVARPAPGPDHRLAGSHLPPRRARPVRARPALDARRLHDRLGVPHDPALPARRARGTDR